ncbi:hypothetical protein C8R45DRAFT_1214985 [Mycena sanguinolenta]|nr:hypothetical protein C8R45DRAFT_1214985 [Mycena sanguinolenta]
MLAAGRRVRRSCSPRHPLRASQAVTPHTSPSASAKALALPEIFLASDIGRTAAGPERLSCYPSRPSSVPPHQPTSIFLVFHSSTRCYPARCFHAAPHASTSAFFTSGHDFRHCWCSAAPDAASAAHAAGGPPDDDYNAREGFGNAGSDELAPRTYDVDTRCCCLGTLSSPALNASITSRDEGPGCSILYVIPSSLPPLALANLPISVQSSLGPADDTGPAAHSLLRWTPSFSTCTTLCRAVCTSVCASHAHETLLASPPPPSSSLSRSSAPQAPPSPAGYRSAPPSLFPFRQRRSLISFSGQSRRAATDILLLFTSFSVTQTWRTLASIAPSALSAGLANGNQDGGVDGVYGGTGRVSTCERERREPSHRSFFPPSQLRRQSSILSFLHISIVPKPLLIAFASAVVISYNLCSCASLPSLLAEDMHRLSLPSFRALPADNMRTVAFSAALSASWGSGMGDADADEERGGSSRRLCATHVDTRLIPCVVRVTFLFPFH